MNATNRCTFDANVLIYALDERADMKRFIAKQIIAKLAETTQPIVPLQTLSEFYRATTRKRILSPDTARAVVGEYQALWEIIPASSEALTDAMSVHREHGLQFFDALLWATVKRAGCTTLITEDFQTSRELGGVTFVNPFLPGFDLTDLIS